MKENPLEALKEELTNATVPKAVSYLIDEIAEMKAMLSHIESQLGLGVDKHRPIEEKRAAEFLDTTERAIKKLVRNQDIPYYQRGNKIYFFEDELLKWVEETRIAPYYEKLKKYRMENPPRTDPVHRIALDP